MPTDFLFDNINDKAHTRTHTNDLMTAMDNNATCCISHKKYEHCSGKTEWLYYQTRVAALLVRRHTKNNVETMYNLFVVCFFF